MEKKPRKNDIILIFVLLLLAVAVYGGFYFYQIKNTHEPVAVVTINGNEFGRYSLSMDQKVEITSETEKYNVLVIKDGKVDMTEGSCPDKICVNHRPISKNGQTIVCLPNEVVVEIENGETSDVDIITN